jgi:hypothetical protein
MKKLKLFENFRQDWEDKLAELEKDAQQEAKSQIEQFLYDLTDDFNNHTELQELSFLKFSISFKFNYREIGEFLDKLRYICPSVEDSMGLKLKLNKTVAEWKYSSGDFSSDRCEVRLFGNSVFLDDFLKGKIETGSQRYNDYLEKDLPELIKSGARRSFKIPIEDVTLTIELLIS